MKTIYKNRLRKLADFLWTLPSQRFNINHWVSKRATPEKFTQQCGTSACALGWACSIPSFAKAGLKMDFKNFEPTFEPKTDADREGARKCAYWYGSGDQLRMYTAGAAFFGISREQSEKFFCPYEYPEQTGHKVTPKAVAKRIYAYLKDQTGKDYTPAGKREKGLARAA